jgi:hypothetical protein
MAANRREICKLVGGWGAGLSCGAGVGYRRPLISRQSGTYSVPFEGLMIIASIITCPHCGASKAESMPTDACQFFYDCTGCGTRLKPTAGDCCVFCS